MTDVLYLIMRTDLASMNPGKLAAQACHCSDAFNKLLIESPHLYDEEYVDGYARWKATTPQGFGTVIVLGGAIDQIKNTINEFWDQGYPAELLQDPTYPIRDGEVVHHIPLATGGFVFVPDKETDNFAAELLAEYELHP